MILYFQFEVMRKKKTRNQIENILGKSIDHYLFHSFSFHHNCLFISSNWKCQITLDIYVLKAFHFVFREVAPWGREHGWNYCFVPFSLGGSPFLPKEVAPREHGQGYHFVLLSLWKNHFCSLRQLVWKNIPRSNFFIHFVYGKNKKIWEKNQTLHPWVEGGSGRGILTTTSFYFSLYLCKKDSLKY